MSRGLDRPALTVAVYNSDATLLDHAVSETYQVFSPEPSVLA